MKYYVCKKMRLLTHLHKNGFMPIRTQPDIKNPKYLVWIFENSEELRDCVESYYNSETFVNKIDC